MTLVPQWRPPWPPASRDRRRRTTCSGCSRTRTFLRVRASADVGGFIASAGLESYYSHGFLTKDQKSGAPHQQALVERTVAFVDHSLTNYVSSVLPYVHAAYRVAQHHLQTPDSDLDGALQALAWLDWQHHTLLLNHVSRRASMIQGIALLSLYSKSFAQPAVYGAPMPGGNDRANKLAERLRMHARRGSARLGSGVRALDTERGELAGHLPICAGVFSACVGLSLDRALRQNLFLQARNIMSCSIRLNTIGPYMAHQLLAFQLRTLVAAHLAKLERTAGERLGEQAWHRAAPRSTATSVQEVEDEAWDWDWDDPDRAQRGFPTTSWPLGEIVQARHDQLHSRLFNS